MNNKYGSILSEYENKNGRIETDDYGNLDMNGKSLTKHISESLNTDDLDLSENAKQRFYQLAQIDKGSPANPDHILAAEKLKAVKDRLNGSNNQRNSGGYNITESTLKVLLEQVVESKIEAELNKVYSNLQSFKKKIAEHEDTISKLNSTNKQLVEAVVSLKRRLNG